MKPIKAKLAINGGAPVRTAFLPYSRHSVSEADIQAVAEVLRFGALTTGPKVKDYEEAFADCVGAKYAVSFSSGTAALHGAIFAAELKPGEEAITTPMTFAATANSVVYQGGVPSFADIYEESLNIDIASIEKKITPQTKIVMPVDYAGQPADLNGVRSLAQKYGLIMIEDAAHALGAIYEGKKIGSISDITVFSTHPAKHITTGEGGIAATNDAHMAARLRIFRNHGIDTDAGIRLKNRTWIYEMTELGYNYRLSDIQCALGISQLRKAEEWLARRNVIAKCYTEAFEKIDSIRVPQFSDSGQSAWHLYVIRLHLEKLKVGREVIFKALQAENIGVNVHYIPVYWHPFYRDKLGFQKGLCPVTENAYERILSLPIFPAMSDQDIEDVIVAVQKVVEAYQFEK